jgi:adenylate cyclase
VVLAPKESCLSILFCDLRGFSRESEQATGRLRELLERVSEALGVMTRHILRTGGVIGDFHGDAAMGFWGWPLATPQDALRALEAALAIAGDFHGDAMKDSRMDGFQVGIGIASGNAVAGRIGSSDQVKVTAFGPVVNRAARLEGITKMIPAPMLIDHATAESVAPFQSSMGFRLREIASVLPYGMSQPIQAFEVIPTAQRDIDRLHSDLLAYAKGRDAFQQGRWKEAREWLEPLQTRDRAAGFLLRHLFDQATSGPWDGIIRLDKK